MGRTEEELDRVSHTGLRSDVGYASAERQSIRERIHRHRENEIPSNSFCESLQFDGAECRYSGLGREVKGEG